MKFKKKWQIFNEKKSVTKFQKSKFWIDSFVAFSVGYVVVYSIFSVGAVFMEKFAIQNCLFFEFSKMFKIPIKLGFFSIFFWHNVYNFFLILSVPWQFLTRRKKSHAISIKNECVRSSRVQAIWWHSPSRDVRPGEFQPYTEPPAQHRVDYVHTP